MQAYKFYPLLAFSLWLLGSDAYAAWCCPDYARCRFSNMYKSDQVVGLLKGGALFEWSYSSAYVACYPTRLNDGGTYDLSTKACAEEFPDCKKEACYVARDNSCPPIPKSYCDPHYVDACVNNGCDGLAAMPNVQPNVIRDCKEGVYEARSKDRDKCKEFVSVYQQTGYIKCDIPL